MNNHKFNTLAHKDSEFVFYRFNDYLFQINEPLKLTCNTIISEDTLVLGTLQERNCRRL